MRHPFLSLVVLPLVALTVGCGPDCQSSCDKIFGTKAEECNITIPGKADASGIQELTAECVSHCEQALARNGEVGTYEPNERTSASDAVALENEKQAALWMDCVSETACEDLNKNFCAPVTNFP